MTGLIVILLFSNVTLLILFLMYRYKFLFAADNYSAVKEGNDVWRARWDDIEKEKKEILNKWGESDRKLREEIARNKSVEVKTGFMVEKMAPFLDIFKHDPGRATFIGQPIDYIVFNEDEIVFVEVKSGKSRTTKKQNNIKELVSSGKVRFELIRLDNE